MALIWPRMTAQTLSFGFSFGAGAAGSLGGGGRQQGLLCKLLGEFGECHPGLMIAHGEFSVPCGVDAEALELWYPVL